MILEYDEELAKECYQREMERRSRRAQEVLSRIFEKQEVLE